jgi:hypothetical protein
MQSQHLFQESILNVDKEACQAALAYSFGALAEALMPVQLAKEQ